MGPRWGVCVLVSPPPFLPLLWLLPGWLGPLLLSSLPLLLFSCLAAPGTVPQCFHLTAACWVAWERSYVTAEACHLNLVDSSVKTLPL